MTQSRESETAIEPPAKLLLCLDRGCYGEFYYPLSPGEAATCPNDRLHPVAIYNHSVNVTALCAACERPIVERCGAE